MIRTLKDRLLSRAFIDESGCWIWTGSSDQYGRGKVAIRRPDGTYYCDIAYRAAYRAFVGQIPAGLEIDHLCRVPACINPQHLEPVAGVENRRRHRESITHCRAGHAFDEHNTHLYVPPRTGSPVRVCRACNRDAVRRYKLRKRGQAS